MPRTTLAVIGAVAAALTLAACATGGSTAADQDATAPATAATAAPTTTPTSSAQASRTPLPTSTITPVPGVDDDAGHVPDTCAGLLTSGMWDDAFTDAPLNDPSVAVDPADPPRTAFTPVLQPDGKRLYCVWRDPRADVSGVMITVVVIDSSRAFDALQDLSGYTCDRGGESYRCQKISQDPQYPVTDGDTYFTRGDIGVRILQSNVSTSGLLDDVVSHLF